MLYASLFSQMYSVTYVFDARYCAGILVVQLIINNVMTECSVSCLECPTNGAGLCDPGKCTTMTVYDSISRTCKGIQRMMLVFFSGQIID